MTNDPYLCSWINIYFLFIHLLRLKQWLVKTRALCDRLDTFWKDACPFTSNFFSILEIHSLPSSFKMLSSGIFSTYFSRIVLSIGNNYQLLLISCLSVIIYNLSFINNVYVSKFSRWISTFSLKSLIMSSFIDFFVELRFRFTCDHWTIFFIVLCRGIAHYSFNYWLFALCI